MAVDLAQLRTEVGHIKDEGGGNPRVHPNGFIQLDLDPVEESWDASKKQGHSGAMRRLHIWNPPGFKLPHQGTVNEIHDHVFDMHSEIVCGTLYQCIYEFSVGDSSDDTGEAPTPTHERYVAVYAQKSDSRLEPTGELGTLKRIDRFPVSKGQCYEQPAFSLHDTETPLGLVVTVMTKMAIHPGTPSVICPIDTPPDNDYDRATAAPADYLWSAIEASLR